MRRRGADESPSPIPPASLSFFFFFFLSTADVYCSNLFNFFSCLFFLCLSFFFELGMYRFFN